MNNKQIQMPHIHINHINQQQMNTHKNRQENSRQIEKSVNIQNQQIKLQDTFQIHQMDNQYYGQLIKCEQLQVYQFQSQPYNKINTHSNFNNQMNIFENIQNIHHHKLTEQHNQNYQQTNKNMNNLIIQEKLSNINTKQIMSAKNNINKSVEEGDNQNHDSYIKQQTQEINQINSSPIKTNQNTQNNQPTHQNHESQRYNSYVNSLINSQFPPTSEPTHEQLQSLYHALQSQFPKCSPKQIIVLLYNNLIKIPREQQMMVQQLVNDEEGDEKYVFDGSKYIETLIGQQELDTFALRRKMVYVYTTKGYGVKVYKEYIQKKNPNEQIMSKEQFKGHFINIYKVIIKRIEDFLVNLCQKHFQPMSRNEFQKTLGDVINCRKYFSTEFCEIFFRLLKCTFDLKVQTVPNQKQVILFYKTVLTKVRESKVIIMKKIQETQQQQDTDIWTQEFENCFITLFIKYRNIAEAKKILLDTNPEYKQFLDDQKLKCKIQNAIRLATRWVQIQNQKCGNHVVFMPTDVDRKFIMTASQLQETRIKLLKVYVKKVNDKEVLARVVEFIHKDLREKYKKQGIPVECIQECANHMAQGHNLQKEQGELMRIIKSQIKKSNTERCYDAVM